MADGASALVALERTGALRALGNGVVPVQAACAFVVLLRRITAIMGRAQEPAGTRLGTTAE